jgi:hypothetical protein
MRVRSTTAPEIAITSVMFAISGLLNYLRRVPKTDKQTMNNSTVQQDKYSTAVQYSSTVQQYSTVQYSAVQ